MRLESCYKIARYHATVIAAVIKLYASAYNYIWPGKAIHLKLIYELIAINHCR
jgi:hypothetical protein